MAPTSHFSSFFVVHYYVLGPLSKTSFKKPKVLLNAVLCFFPHSTLPNDEKPLISNDGGRFEDSQKAPSHHPFCVKYPTCLKAGRK